ncbi:MAG: hypothetical protein J5J04_06215 [Anaerolineae bacterium]|nr:MAG: hypothetical protein UZ13_03807 [Chloroflexi bacterium OLB13]MBV6437182.1 hypothetical protein [Anaerolineae bacterium]MDL1916746.1 hypothetical protein [Anaerolineae bacterium CFX4]MEB2367265.1 hypothetical protein [Chloroflexota bacterium]MBW7879164.1 hypothetical protein [Anaerolineae bacterium]
MRKRDRRYVFLRLMALLLIILGIVAALAGIFAGSVMIIRPSLILGDSADASMRNTYTLIGALIIIGGLVGGLVLAAMGQFYQVVLELLYVNRTQGKALTYMAKHQ